jgi:hypothetical protein
VAARVGTMHRWLVRYLTGQLGGGESSHPPVSSSRQVAVAITGPVDPTLLVR